MQSLSVTASSVAVHPPVCNFTFFFVNRFIKSERKTNQPCWWENKTFSPLSASRLFNSVCFFHSTFMSQWPVLASNLIPSHPLLSWKCFFLITEWSNELLWQKMVIISLLLHEVMTPLVFQNILLCLPSTKCPKFRWKTKQNNDVAGWWCSRATKSLCWVYLV